MYFIASSWGRSEPTDRNVELYPQFFLELITTQLRFYMVSPQLSLLNKKIVKSHSDCSYSFQHGISVIGLHELILYFTNTCTCTCSTQDRNTLRIASCHPQLIKCFFRKLFFFFPKIINWVYLMDTKKCSQTYTAWFKGTTSSRSTGHGISMLVFD